MKNLIIIGARGAGREVYAIALVTKEYNKEYVIKGFLDDKIDALDNMEGYPPIISSVEDYIPQKDDVFVCALGDPYFRRIYAEKIIFKGGVFINLIAKSASIGKNTKIGKGCIIHADTTLTCDIVLGDFVYVQAKCIIGHDAIIGNYCHLNSYSFVGGYCELEDMCVMHPKATLLPHKKMFKGSIIGANSVAIRNVKAGTTVMGVPAKKIEF